MMSRNVISTRDIRAYTGSANHVANILFIWRPFLDPLWAAAAERSRDESKTRAPAGMIWAKHVSESLAWIEYFLATMNGPLHREWDVQSFFEDPPYVTFVLDASPWSLAGVLLLGGIPVTYFVSPLTHHDEIIHNFNIGSHRGQQAW